MTTASSAAPVRTDLTVVVIAYLSFIVLGMPNAMLGVAWPYMRETFALPLDAVGALLTSSTLGYFAASFISGRLITRVGVAPLFGVAALLGALGLLGYTLAPGWLMIVVLGLLVGTGAGFLDGGMNVFFAANYGPRLMNWLHASFGVGSTLGPLLTTTLLNNGSSWRVPPLVIAGFYGALAVTFLFTRSRWHMVVPVSADGGRHRGTPVGQTLRLPVVWMGIVLFAAYAGLETVAGQWSFPLFTTVRAVAEDTAGIWVSMYWASFTIGRILFGAIVTWIRPSTLIRACIVGAGVGAIIFWWSPTSEVGFIGLLVYGFALAPIFALMVTATQERLGPKHAPNAIGFQVAAGSIGLGILPGIAGVAANRLGLEVIGPILVGLVLVVAVLYEVISNHRHTSETL